MQPATQPSAAQRERVVAELSWRTKEKGGDEKGEGAAQCHRLVLGEVVDPPGGEDHLYDVKTCDGGADEKREEDLMPQFWT